MILYMYISVNARLKVYVQYGICCCYPQCGGPYAVLWLSVMFTILMKIYEQIYNKYTQACCKIY